MSNLLGSIADVVVDPMAKIQTDNDDDPSGDTANVLDGEDAERIQTLIRAFSSLMKAMVLPVPEDDQIPWCYMIIMPDLNTEGISRSLAPIASRTLPVTGTITYPTRKPQKWFVKFGDGDPTISGRYGTHNPSYSFQVNETGRKGRELMNKVFIDQGFQPAGESSEWFCLSDRPLNDDNLLKKDLKKLFNEFAGVDFGDFSQEDAFVKNALKVTKDRRALGV